MIPTAPGEGLKHIPHGSDWSSIREAGMKADKLGVSPGDAASIDGYGYEQEGNETVVTTNQRKGLMRWSQKASGSGPSILNATGIHPIWTSAEVFHSNPIVKLESGTE